MTMAAARFRGVSSDGGRCPAQGGPAGRRPPLTGQTADEAVTMMYQTHYATLVRTAALLVGDVTTAEDVVQDSLIACTARGGGCETPATRCRTCAVR